MTDKALNSCPYCGNKNINIDVDIRVGCHLEDGQLMLNDGYADQIPEAVNSSDYEDMGGYCPECGHYFNVTDIDDKGFYFEKLKPGHERDMEKKYSRRVYVISVDDHQSGPENVAAFRTIEEAETFFRKTIEEHYWKPGTPWNDQYSDSIEDAIHIGQYTSDMDDMVTIDSFNI